MSDEDSDSGGDADSSFPAITRALKLLSSRLGVDKNKVDDPSTHVSMSMSTSSVDARSHDSVHDESEEHDTHNDSVLHLTGERQSVSQVSSRDWFKVAEPEPEPEPEPDCLRASMASMHSNLTSDSLERVPTVQDTITHRPCRESALTGLSLLARHQMVKARVYCEAPALTRQARVLQKALNWCSEWRIKSLVIKRMIQFAKERSALKIKFGKCASRIYDSENYYRVFSRDMISHCRNRFGKVRVSELYSAWRVKREYLKKWFRYAARKYL